MSVALSNGASVVAFIGLSAETLRGFLFLYDFVESVKDAPGDLRYLYVQLTFLQVQFATFRESVTEAGRLGILGTLSEQTRLALDDAETTIKDFKTIMEEYGEGRATPMRKRIKVARRRAQLAKMSQRLGNISSQISMTHSGIALLNQSQTQLSINNSQELDGKLAVLADTVTSRTTAIISERCDTMSKVMEEATNSILHLIGDLSHKLSTIPTSVTKNPSSQGLSPYLEPRNNIVSKGYVVDAQLSASIREAVSEVLPQMLQNSELANINPSLIHEIKRKLFNDGLMSPESNPTATGTRNFPEYTTTGSSIHRLYWLPYTAVVNAGNLFRQRFTIQGTTLRALHFSAWGLSSRVSIKTFFSWHSKDHVTPKEHALTAENSTTILQKQTGGLSIYLFVVFRPGKYSSRVVEIDLANMSSDIEFFRVLRETHAAQRTRLQRFLSHKRVTEVKFASFKISRKGFAHIKSIGADLGPYPSPDNKNYHYSPKPPQLIPPVGQRHMAWLLAHPEYAKDELIVLDRLPKSSVRLRELLQDRNSIMPQYGLSIAEDLDLKKIAVLLFFATSATSVIIGALWSMYGWDIQSSFAVGSYILTLLTVGFTSVQAMIEYVE